MSTGPATPPRKPQPILGYTILGATPEWRGVLWATSGGRKERGGLFVSRFAELYPTRPAARAAIARSLRYWSAYCTKHKIRNEDPREARYRIVAVKACR